MKEMTGVHFEQGPIRPPSEAYSLLVRVTRNCPWNRCEFCHTYKHEKFSIRTVEEVKGDIDAVREIVQEVKGVSWQHGFGGDIPAPLLQHLLQEGSRYPDTLRSVALWLYAGGRNVFLQDGDSLILPTNQVMEILKYLKATFPSIERITTYARAKTVSKKTIEELGDLYHAGLSRIHIGLETGHDPLLEYVKKGVTAREQIDAGKKVRESRISLSEYVILGLGGRSMWRDHAIQTGKVLNEINPDFIRFRTLKVLKMMPLYGKVLRDEFALLSDDEIVKEERLLINTLDGITSTLKSDHILNLLEEVEGKLPEEKGKMLALIDRYLGLTSEEKTNFRLGRRAGVYRSLADLCDSELHSQIDKALRQIESERPDNVEKVLSDLMESFI